MIATVLSLLSAIGVTAGAHRLYSHKAYKAKFLMKLFVIVLQTVAGQVSKIDAGHLNVY